MSVVIHGRVVDTDGRPVAGARVLLGDAFVPEPALGETATKSGLTPSVAITSPAGTYTFSESLLQTVARAPEGRVQRVFVRAIHGEQASWKALLDWNGDKLAAPELVIVPGVLGHIMVRWSDGVAAVGVSLLVLLEDPQIALDGERARVVSFEGLTDEQGQLAFGPVPDQTFGVLVVASHPEGAPKRASWTTRLHDALELDLLRGRTVRGRLTTADGQPAAGYRVAPWNRNTGAPPERNRVVNTDSDGGFEVAGLDPRTGSIAVFDRLARAKKPTLAELLTQQGSLTNALLVHDVPSGHADLGAVSLPTLGTFALHLEDTSGGRPLSARAAWMRLDVRSARFHKADSEGVVHFDRVPLGIPVVLHVITEDAEYGELEQHFRIEEVMEGTVCLRVSGAGTVVVRLHPKGALQTPLVVRHATVQWSEHHGLARKRGPTSELRGWTSPGSYAVMKVRAQGFREREIENIVVRHDGPTFLDVELDSR